VLKAQRYQLSEAYDLDILNTENGKLHAINVKKFESALDLNAKERSRRFASINTKGSLSEVRDEIRKRSVSLFQPRPVYSTLSSLGKEGFACHHLVFPLHCPAVFPRPLCR
jgi:hypothetical protein